MKFVIGLAAGLLLSACAGLRTEPPPRIAIGEIRPLPGGGGVAVGVTLTNPGRRPTQRVTVRCTYLDSAGAAVGGGLVYFNKVPAGGSDTVDQMVVVPGVVRGDCAVNKATG